MSIYRRLLPVFLLMTTTACVDTGVPRYQAPLDYRAQKPYALDVSEAVVVNESVSNPLTQEFAGKYGTTLESALNEWAQNRVLASGPQGTLLVTIRNANFEASKLQTEKSGVEGYFTREQIARWSANLEVELSIKGNSTKQPTAEISVIVSANRTVPEKASDEEKAKAYQSLVNELLTRFNEEVDKQAQIYFSSYLL